MTNMCSVVITLKKVLVLIDWNLNAIYLNDLNTIYLDNYTFYANGFLGKQMLQGQLVNIFPTIYNQQSK